MGGSLTVRQARLVLPDRVVTGDLVVEDGIITEIAPRVDRSVGVEVDGRERVLLPGAIDLVVHLDTIEDLSAASASAVAGGVTALCAVGPAETDEELRVELGRAAELSRTHYGLYVRARADAPVEAERARGIWVSGEVLHADGADELFAGAARLLVVDNQDPARLRSRAAMYPDAADPADHTRIHDVDSALAATRRALDLAQRHGRPTLVSQVSAAEELEVVRGRSACAAAGVRPVHLFLDDRDYARLGTRAVATPPVRAPRHRDALFAALTSGGLDVVCSHHHGVRKEWKDRPYPTTAEGAPAAGWMAPLLAHAVAEGRADWSLVARVLAETPARVLRLARKGRLETGYDGDLVLLDPSLERPVEAGSCGWSPWEGAVLRGWPVMTVVFGAIAWADGEGERGVRGRPL